MRYNEDFYIEDVRIKYESSKKWVEEHPNCIGKIWNPFTFSDIQVYTDVESFESIYSHVYEYSYKELGNRYAKWIEDTKLKLMRERTSSELKFSQIIRQSNTTVIEQPYFKINNKGYFLDFYLPDYGLAFELNGKIHKGIDNEYYDKERDYAFHSIGIRTIRLSNLDIKCDNFKEKINEWANKSLSGDFDPSLYYKRPNANKFDGKDTIFQDLHKRINKILSKPKYKGKTVLIETNHTYLCKVLENKRYDTDYLANKPLVDEYFDIVENNNISVHTYFIGNMQNMGRSRFMEWVEHNNAAVGRRIDKVIRVLDKTISGNLEYEYGDFHKLQYRIEKPDEGSTFSCCAPCYYGMFFPCKKENARKRKYRKIPVIIGSSCCTICHFCKGNDRENGVVKCAGFNNKGTKNIYDNIELKDFCNEKDRFDYKTLMEVKETPLYAQVMKHIR